MSRVPEGGRRELRTCPVEGLTVLINTRIPATALRSPTAMHPPGTDTRATGAPDWRPQAPPWLGVEGLPAVHREPAVYRDGLGAHELLRGALPAALELAVARIGDLEGDVRLRSFKLAGRAVAGRCEELQLVALPFETPTSAPERWRDQEAGGPRSVEVWDDAVAVLAWAPRVPLEAWVLPRHGRERFAGSRPGPVGMLAERTLPRLSAALGGCDVDVVLVEGEPWRLELRPCVAVDPIYGLATDMPAHGVFPELGAAWIADFAPLQPSSPR